MEGASDEGGGGDVAEAHLLANYCVLLDHVWMHVINDLSIVRVGRRYWPKEEIKKVCTPFLKFNIRGKLLYQVSNLLRPIHNITPVTPVSTFRKAQNLSQDPQNDFFKKIVAVRIKIHRAAEQSYRERADGRIPGKQRRHKCLPDRIPAIWGILIHGRADDKDSNRFGRQD